MCDSDADKYLKREPKLAEIPFNKTAYEPYRENPSKPKFAVFSQSIDIHAADWRD